MNFSFNDIVTIFQQSYCPKSTVREVRGKLSTVMAELNSLEHILLVNDENKNHDSNNGRFISGSNGSTASAKHEEDAHDLVTQGKLPGEKTEKNTNRSGSVVREVTSSQPKEDAKSYQHEIGKSLIDNGHTFNRTVIRNEGTTKAFPSDLYSDSSNNTIIINNRGPEAAGSRTGDETHTIEVHGLRILNGKRLKIKIKPKEDGKNDK